MILGCSTRKLGRTGIETVTDFVTSIICQQEVGLHKSGWRNLILYEGRWVRHLIPTVGNFLDHNGQLLRTFLLLRIGRAPFVTPPLWPLTTESIQPRQIGHAKKPILGPVASLTHSAAQWLPSSTRLPRYMFEERTKWGHMENNKVQT